MVQKHVSFDKTKPVAKIVKDPSSDTHTHTKVPDVLFVKTCLLIRGSIAGSRTVVSHIHFLLFMNTAVSKYEAEYFLHRESFLSIVQTYRQETKVELVIMHRYDSVLVRLKVHTIHVRIYILRTIIRVYILCMW